ncbi:precorrin-2 dehydrogenase/sirohydrochlorin ferrochelatase family protein [Paenibacillus chibensis]|uniref:precorrin-2 dehydrogenase/sirohydrochlorin ferrochelatase family protein n=1 Tax=Paenibacillus chibensis TaxID=59846 RepID=UPI001FE97B3E|nr:bifunctional precorrin-2 dehydrogenase/sirohydrochlorin ferrochelatase [Paenibacillus chibensis]MEC0372344.1 bifunctional precorrin-2 dehydrogenase/sirohydrochlorin ferrochelatase [Paenibacillus chibensis]
MSTYVPVMLDCKDRVCIVIGGGQVAERKVKELLAGQASVTVISPSVTPALRHGHEQGELRWLCRKYAEGDLQGAFMVHAASDDPKVNENVVAEARTRGILANVADQPQLGNFIHPSVLRRGRLVISVSTSGAGPLAARAIRRRLEEDFGKEFEAYLDLLYDLRNGIKQQVSDPVTRQALLRKASDLRLADALRHGAARPWSMEEIEQWIKDNQEEWECGQS